MYNLPTTATLSQAELYDAIVEQVRLITDGESDLVANLANTSSVLFHMLPNVNWVGAYLFDGTELVLGPFQGKPACIRIACGRGVCGWAFTERRVMVVDDVSQFPGHIACDAETKSELVVPLFRGEDLVGVLDLDSPLLARFGQAEAEMVLRIAEILMSR